jgi:hypothetical protein
LPGTGWLQQNKHHGLDLAIRKDPEAFSHFSREQQINALETHLKTATDLAAKNGGLLPSGHRLKTGGHSGLYKMMRKHPKAFSHFQQQHGKVA